jgi:4-amino-4-deoxy-L-arabinose transferase-like glycosyltransferase
MLRRSFRADRLALAGILALSLVLNTHKLAQNAWANTFYSAGVKSMLGSLHNFLFASFDPGGLVTIDKPPLGVWTQLASAKLFGFTPLSLLLPEAILGTIAVAVLYLVLARRLGVAAGLAGALTLAVFPSFVAVSRDNGVDPLLILLMLLACAAALSAIESGRWRSLLACAVLVGLAFNTKTLAAYLIVPGIALAYLVCAPGSWRRRARMLLVAGLLMAIVSFSWIALVELTPASQRPYVGSSTNNTELGLTFSYNGFGRVEGEVGGPGNIPTGGGATVHSAPGRPTAGHAGPSTKPKRTLPKPTPSRYLPDGRYRYPIAFGGPTGPLRLFESGLAGQGAWMLPFAVFGLLALALLTLGSGRKRRDPRLAVVIVLGGWLLLEVVVLSFSEGIVHPYYISAMAPGVAAMVGAGAFAFVRFARDRDPRLVLLPCAVVGTVVAQVSILNDQRYGQWLIPILIGGATIGLVAMAARRIAAPAMAFLLGLLLVAPAAYATTTWLAPVEGTFPAAGPHEATGDGRFGGDAFATQLDRNLAGYVDAHRTGTRWSVLTDASPTAAPLILLGSPAGALGGYGGTDPVLDGPSLARLIARGEARYVVLGGAYASRGGNLATKAVLRACPQVPAEAWHGPTPSRRVLVLFDCAGRERSLAASTRR